MQDENALREVAKDCVHCGFCLPACPTYQLWAEEMDSPRGRIYLLNQILDGAELSSAAAEHFDRCLGCMACMTACPSGVQYDQLIEAARVWTEEARSGSGVQPAVASRASDETGNGRVAEVRGADAVGTGPDPGMPDMASAPKRPVRDRIARTAIFSLFPYPRRLRAMTAPLRLAQRTGLDRRLAHSSLPGRVSPALGAAVRLAPPGVSAAEARPLPRRVPALGTRRAVVGMLTGCVQSVFFPRVNAATARVLAAEGCDVIIPRGQGCCGALSLHSGREAEATAFARRTIATFEQAGVDAVVVNSAGCGSAMKEYERLLHGADGAAASAAGHRGLSRRLPPGARAADHQAAARPAAGDPGADPGRDTRRGHLLWFGRRVQPAAARGGQRAGCPQGRIGAVHRGVAADLGQPGLLASDRLRPGRTRPGHRGRAHRGGP